MIGDLSPVAADLSFADGIFLDLALLEKVKMETERQYSMLDVRFYLSRLSAAFTGGDGLNYLPSYVHAMEKKLSGE